MIKLSSLPDNVFLSVGDYSITTKAEYLKNISDYEDMEVRYQGFIVENDINPCED